MNCFLKHLILTRAVVEVARLLTDVLVEIRAGAPGGGSGSLNAQPER